MTGIQQEHPPGSVTQNSARREMRAFAHREHRVGANRTENSGQRLPRGSSLVPCTRAATTRRPRRPLARKGAAAGRGKRCVARARHAAEPAAEPAPTAASAPANAMRFRDTQWILGINYSLLGTRDGRDSGGAEISPKSISQTRLFGLLFGDWSTKN